ncbi:hypothetical protein CW304_02245 [Bacillus sp. UFRGS-B20]|nr:hypothetical protein CW304_02245 [Bacillus sp. UFRGS-B20]
MHVMIIQFPQRTYRILLCIFGSISQRIAFIACVTDITIHVFACLTSSSLQHVFVTPFLFFFYSTGLSIYPPYCQCKKSAIGRV